MYYSDTRENVYKIPSQFRLESFRQSIKKTKPKITLQTLAQMKECGESVSALVIGNAYGARLVEQGQIEVMVVAFSDGPPKGMPSEDTATLDDTKVALLEARSENESAFLVGDIPKLSYQNLPDLPRHSELLAKAGADAVKIEGGRAMAPIVRQVRQSGIPVVGHIGYMPKLGMPRRKRGSTLDDLRALEADAEALVVAGVSALVLEFIAPEVATYLTQKMHVPTFGIYSGGGTSGQVLVLNDILGHTDFSSGFFPKGRPKMIGEWNGSPESRVSMFRLAVKTREFPLLCSFGAHSYESNEDWIPSGGHFKGF